MNDKRAYALRTGVLGDPGARDGQGRLTDFYDTDLEVGDAVFVCNEDGKPELEVRLALNEAGQRVGILTGQQRPCGVERDEG